MATGHDNDTDPLADTQTSDHPSSPESRDGVKKRAVHTGDVLGRYELVAEVGEGGMASVYRARDQELRREVAVKVLFPHLARRPEIVRRFQREARAAANLEHRNILRVYDVGGGEGEDPPYIVMELIRGRSLLGELEQKGPMLAEVVACLGALLADALGAAHAAGIIHRDVKPANVMIASDGRVLLADFGVARLETEDSLVTKTGSLLGTPAYMSPEQASGDTAIAKSDLYSLGATLYQLATGVLPYSGPPAKVMAQIATGALVPAVKRRSAVGPDLSRVIGHLMASDPMARPANAADVAKELRAIAVGAGFGEPADEAAAFFKDPDGFTRQKTPAIITSLVTAAKGALGESKLPRAMALADRASALAPEDPAVITLVESVTEGGRSSRRRRIAGGVAIAACLAAGTVAGVRMLRGHQGAAVVADASRDAASDGRSMDAPPIDAPAVIPAVMIDAAAADAEIAVPTIDAARAHPRIDAAAVAMIAEAGIAIDAGADAAVPPPPIDAAAPGTIVVKNDLWCNVSIDGSPPVRLDKQRFSVPAGHHTVTCAQSASRTWTKQVDVGSGEIKTVEDHMLAMVPVRFEVDASLEGASHHRGEVVQVQQGSRLLETASAKKYATIKVACTVRESPGEPLDCYVP